MNAMAQRAAPQPEYIIVNDGKPVDSVGGQPSKLGKLFKLALPALAMLFVGYLLGGIIKTNQVYNKTVDDAGVLLEDFKGVGKGLQALQDALLTARGKPPLDKDLTDALAAMVKDDGMGGGAKLRTPDTGILFRANVTLMDPKTSGKIFKFYQDMTELTELVDEHVLQAKRDLGKAAPKDPAPRKPISAYGIVIRKTEKAADGSGGFPTAELVELGAPVCPDGKINPAGCPSGLPDKFQVRTDPLVAWAAGGPTLPYVKDPNAMAVDQLFFLQVSAVAKAFMVGADNFVDVIGAQKRLARINELAGQLGQDRADIEKALTAQKNLDKRFAL
jgi:hypothetical protein